jgi:hypothetical protein
MTRGLEFGASPMPETRRKMMERGQLFGTPGYLWLPAESRVHAEYEAFIDTADSIPDEL